MRPAFWVKDWKNASPEDPAGSIFWVLPSLLPQVMVVVVVVPVEVDLA